MTRSRPDRHGDHPLAPQPSTNNLTNPNGRQNTDKMRIADKHPKVGAWLAKRPRFHLHFTPTSASWLNQVERWFGLISQRAIKRGSFDSVAQLVKTIEAFIAHHNASSSPFIWVATAESIFGKLERLSARICGTSH